MESCVRCNKTDWEMKRWIPSQTKNTKVGRVLKGRKPCICLSQVIYYHYTGAYVALELESVGVSHPWNLTEWKLDKCFVLI